MPATWQDPPEYRDPGGGGPQLAMPSITPMVKKILLANAGVFLFTFVLFLINQELWIGERGVLTLFGIQPLLWREWAPFLPIWQLLTWGFLHSVTTPTHILFNMLGLYFFGTMMEGIVGGRRFLGLYGSALLVSGLATLLVGLAVGTTAPTLGASGAVLGVVVAAATMRPDARVIFILFPMTLRTLAFVIVGLDAFNLLLQMSGNAASDNVAHLAHLSGAAWGFLVVKRGWIWKDPLETVDNWRVERTERREQQDTVEVDRLLEKIHKEGIGSLSASEKAILKRASKKN